MRHILSKYNLEGKAPFLKRSTTERPTTLVGNQAPSFRCAWRRRSPSSGRRGSRRPPGHRSQSPWVQAWSKRCWQKIDSQHEKEEKKTTQQKEKSYFFLLGRFRAFWPACYCRINSLFWWRQRCIKQYIFLEVVRLLECFYDAPLEYIIKQLHHHAAQNRLLIKDFSWWRKMI